MIGIVEYINDERLIDLAVVSVCCHPLAFLFVKQRNPFQAARALQAHSVHVRLGFGYFFFTIGVGLIKFHEIPKGFDGTFRHALVVNAFVGLGLI